MFHPNVYANGKLCLDKHQVLVVGAGSAIIHFQELLFGSILLIWTTLIYLLNIHSKRVQQLISSFNRDLQIDKSLFLANFDFWKEVIRRVWDESLCVLILGMPKYWMAKGKRLRWWEEVLGAPCLVNFDGTHGERLVENRECATIRGAWCGESVIRSEFTGPDCFWKPHNAADLVGVTTFFGRADVVPFLFTVVSSMTNGPRIPSNQNTQVQMRRKVRLVLRALENKIVFSPISVPWEAVQATSKNRRWPWWLQGARSDVLIEYEDGQSTKANGTTISRIRHTRLPRSLGLRDDFKVMPMLSKLFHNNHLIISTTLDKVDRALRFKKVRATVEASWVDSQRSANRGGGR
ncbi:hypothetical protein PtA15_11A703 [Puccinia triticina]|uniref:SNF2 N-terminal domain-containing protein n=1 Tax=Puccinia triticina TaxID=208348 RepID=A0ABY7D0Y4_9BASI|nr:uncharacterized protein PtA15_11A703 [Puccinia triticina]WAQ90011.1 hypothetical protein PtA15_11A703 [Puccinia triticina]